MPRLRARVRVRVPLGLAELVPHCADMYTGAVLHWRGATLARCYTGAVPPWLGGLMVPQRTSVPHAAAAR